MRRVASQVPRNGTLGPPALDAVGRHAGCGVSDPVLRVSLCAAFMTRPTRYTRVIPKLPSCMPPAAARFEIHGTKQSLSCAETKWLSHCFNLPCATSLP